MSTLNIREILIAPDSFKECLSALEVAENLKTGFERSPLGANVKVLPMADGGEGTVESLVDATSGKIIEVEVTGPLGNKIDSFFGILGDGRTAAIEMAAASGLPLVPDDKLNPELTTSYGTGELIKAALDHNCDKIIIGIGGSATNDGGVGMAQALGVSFKNHQGEEVGFGGRELKKIKNINLDNLDPRLNNVQIEAACDVDNPLCGRRGAANVYGPQKGADRNQIRKLDEGLKNLAEIIKQDLGKEILNMPGSGAAGGLGAGLKAFLDAELKPGIDIVINASGIKELISEMDLVITGEGMLDGQTVYGKTPAGVAQLAKQHDIPVLAVAGSIGSEAEKVYQAGIMSYFSILDRPMELKEARRDAPVMLQNLGENLGRLFAGFC